jgi:hypothetical protein
LCRGRQLGWRNTCWPATILVGDPAEPLGGPHALDPAIDPRGLPSRTNEGWFETACAHAALAGLAGRAGSGVSAAEAVTEADAAMALLRRAVAMGYRSPDVFRAEGALDPLRDREDFRALMMDLAFPAQVFARGD